MRSYYFPSIEVRDGLCPAVDSALTLHGIGADRVLVVDNKSNEATRRAFVFHGSLSLA